MSRRAVVALRATACLIFALIVLVPLLWDISGSLHSNGNLFSNPFQWVPPRLEFGNYPNAWRAIPFGRELLNSFGIASVLAIFGVGLGHMAGYAMGKFRFLGRDVIFWCIVATMLVPFPAIMVPVFVITKMFGLVNTYLGVIVPGLMTAQVVFFMRQYLLGIPDELLESGRVDGASEWRLYVAVVLPMSWPVMVAMGILTFVGSWNNLLWPLIVIESQRLFTVPLGLTQFQSQFFTNYVDILCMALIAMVPVTALFLVGRRRLFDSIMVNGGALVG